MNENPQIKPEDQPAFFFPAKPVLSPEDRAAFDGVAEVIGTEAALKMSSEDRRQIFAIALMYDALTAAQIPLETSSHTTPMNETPQIDPEQQPAFRIPEDALISSEDRAIFAGIVTANHLSSDDNQKLIDIASHCAVLGAIEGRKQLDATWAAQRVLWKKEILENPELSGKNGDLARKVVHEFGTRELMPFLATGWGDNPALFRCFVAIGKKLFGEPTSTEASE